MNLVRAVAIAGFALLASGCAATGGLDGDDMARFAYLGVILVALVSGVFGSGIGMNNVLRGIAIWLAIILLIAAAWQYRDLFVPGTNPGATVVELIPQSSSNG